MGCLVGGCVFEVVEVCVFGFCFCIGWGRSVCCVKKVEVGC